MAANVQMRERLPRAPTRPCRSLRVAIACRPTFGTDVRSAVEAVGNLPLVAMVEGGPERQLDPVTRCPVINEEHSDPTTQMIQRSRHSSPFEAGTLARPLRRSGRCSRPPTTGGGEHCGPTLDATSVTTKQQRLPTIAAGREHAGTGHEAVLMQHLGNAYFAAEEYASAATSFGRALILRTASGADRSLVESSRRALERARALARRNALND